MTFASTVIVGSPNFVVTANGTAITIPTGAKGPYPAWSGKGVHYEGGSGGVTCLRFYTQPK